MQKNNNQNFDFDLDKNDKSRRSQRKEKNHATKNQSIYNQKEVIVNEHKTIDEIKKDKKTSVSVNLSNKYSVSKSVNKDVKTLADFKIIEDDLKLIHKIVFKFIDKEAINIEEIAKSKKLEPESINTRLKQINVSSIKKIITSIIADKCNQSTNMQDIELQSYAKKCFEQLIKILDLCIMNIKSIENFKFDNKDSINENLKTNISEISKNIKKISELIFSEKFNDTANLSKYQIIFLINFPKFIKDNFKNIDHAKMSNIDLKSIINSFKEYDLKLKDLELIKDKEKSEKLKLQEPIEEGSNIFKIIFDKNSQSNNLLKNQIIVLENFPQLIKDNFKSINHTKINFDQLTSIITNYLIIEKSKETNQVQNQSETKFSKLERKNQKRKEAKQKKKDNKNSTDNTDNKDNKGKIEFKYDLKDILGLDPIKLFTKMQKAKENTIEIQKNTTGMQESKQKNNSKLVDLFIFMYEKQIKIDFNEIDINNFISLFPNLDDFKTFSKNTSFISNIASTNSEKLEKILIILIEKEEIEIDFVAKILDANKNFQQITNLRTKLLDLYDIRFSKESHSLIVDYLDIKYLSENNLSDSNFTKGLISDSNLNKDYSNFLNSVQNFKKYFNKLQISPKKDDRDNTDIALKMKKVFSEISIDFLNMEKEILLQSSIFPLEPIETILDISIKNLMNNYNVKNNYDYRYKFNLFTKDEFIIKKSIQFYNKLLLSLEIKENSKENFSLLSRQEAYDKLYEILLNNNLNDKLVNAHISELIFLCIVLSSNLCSNEAYDPLDANLYSDETIKNFLFNFINKKFSKDKEQNNLIKILVNNLNFQLDCNKNDLNSNIDVLDKLTIAINQKKIICFLLKSLMYKEDFINKIKKITATLSSQNNDYMNSWFDLQIKYLKNFDNPLAKFSFTKKLQKQIEEGKLIKYDHFIEAKIMSINFSSALTISKDEFEEEIKSKSLPNVRLASNCIILHNLSSILDDKYIININYDKKESIKDIYNMLTELDIAIVHDSEFKQLLSIKETKAQTEDTTQKDSVNQDFQDTEEIKKNTFDDNIKVDLVGRDSQDKHNLETDLVGQDSQDKQDKAEITGAEEISENTEKETKKDSVGQDFQNTEEIKENTFDDNIKADPMGRDSQVIENLDIDLAS